MIKVTSKKIFAVYALCAVLILLYVLSLTAFAPDGKNKRQAQNIQLLHEADIAAIDQIIIQNNSSAILLIRQNNMWLASSDFSGDNFIPADTSMLQKLFVNLATVHKMTKAGKKNDVQTYGLSQNDVTAISLYKDGLEYEHLFFGNPDFTQSERYFTTSELNSVFLIDTSFDSFLSVSSQTWYDAYLISSQLKEQVFQMGDIQSLSKEAAQKLLELRHGGFASVQEINLVQANTVMPEYNLTLHMGDKSVIKLDFYNCDIAKDASDYVVKVEFNSARTGQSFTYYTKISLWTYNKIKEITL